jgi:DNA-binding beta-propeller fold protein YncE
MLSAQTHGLSVAPDGTLYCADNGTHTITRWSPEGELLMTLGTPGNGAAKWSGDPFNLPTDAAVSPRTGNLYVTDGYGNSRVHVFSPEGKHLLSWGSPGIDAGQFIRPHNIAIDEAERIYVADRHNHRVQVFDAEGGFLEMWNNIYLPCALGLGPDGNVYIGELAAGEGGMAGGMARESPFTLADAPGIGHRLDIYSREGKLLARLGDIWPGEAPGQFIAPHGIAVDSRGDIYVSEVATSIYGRNLNPPREVQCLRKLRRIA